MGRGFVFDGTLADAGKGTHAKTPSFWEAAHLKTPNITRQGLSNLKERLEGSRGSRGPPGALQGLQGLQSITWARCVLSAD